LFLIAWIPHPLNLKLNQTATKNTFKTMLFLTSVVRTEGIHRTVCNKIMGNNVGGTLQRMNDCHVTANMKSNHNNL
jgi:hypothetical protein